MNSLTNRWSLTAFFLSALALVLLLITATKTPAQTELKTTEIAMRGCVNYDHEKTGYVFDDKDSLEAAFYPANEYNKSCRKAARDIDFAKYSLLGVDIRNAQCHDFTLEQKVIRDDAAKLYRFQVTHPAYGPSCRGISTHGAWVLSPKLPAGYRVTFDISQRLTEEEKEFGPEVRFFNVGGMRSFPNTCLQVSSRVYNDESLKDLLSFDQCRKMFGPDNVDKVDLKKETMIGWQTGGDCHMMVETTLYRDDQKKLFTLLVKNRYGGCRAAGWKHGLFTIPKIPDDYQVKFVERGMGDYTTDSFSESPGDHGLWSADGRNLAPKPNISPAPESTPPPQPSPEPPADAAPSDNFGKEIKLPVRDYFGGRNNFGCLHIGNRVYNEESWKKLFDFERCKENLKVDQYDLKKQTLIGYSVGGDCHMSLKMRLYRDDEKKLYTLVIRNIWGGCRAGGWRQGLFAIDKIPADYKFKFVEYLVEDNLDLDLREKSGSGAIWTADGKQVIEVSPTQSKP